MLILLFVFFIILLWIVHFILIGLHTHKKIIGCGALSFFVAVLDVVIQHGHWMSTVDRLSPCLLLPQLFTAQMAGWRSSLSGLLTIKGVRVHLAGHFG